MEHPIQFHNRSLFNSSTLSPQTLTSSRRVSDAADIVPNRAFPDIALSARALGTRVKHSNINFRDQHDLGYGVCTAHGHGENQAMM
jgi:hypothetical protein